VTPGEPFQLFVDERQERVKGLAVALAPGGEQRGDLGSRWRLLRHGDGIEAAIVSRVIGLASVSRIYR
jgi:hypothetical protein